MSIRLVLYGLNGKDILVPFKEQARLWKRKTIWSTFMDEKQIG
jgi:hypothetical protein